MRLISLPPFLMALLALGFSRPSLRAQQSPAGGAAAPVAGSIVEDRAAKKLLEAGDARLEADENDKALEIWKSVIERYPRSKVRFEAHMKIGNFLLEKNSAYEEARRQFEAVDVDANTSSEQRAAAALKTGICFYEARLYGQSFKTLRRVIDEYPAMPEVNDAYYYIGLGHFKLGHYSRAIEALENVGTALNEEDAAVEKVEAGKRFYIKVNDQDLAVLEPGESVTLVCRTKGGDEEKVLCDPLGRAARVILGSLPTVLGSPVKGNGRLEVQGNDEVSVYYTDAQTADRKFDQERIYGVKVAGSAVVQIKDGSFGDTLAGVVIGKSANLEITDADFDRTQGADQLKAMAEIWREKTQAEMDAEIAEAVAKRDPLAAVTQQPEVDRYRKIDETQVTLTEIDIPPPAIEADAPKSSDEAKGEGSELPKGGTPDAPAAAPASPAAAPTPADPALAPVPSGIHSGVFRGSVAIDKADQPRAGDAVLQAGPGDLLKLRYVDEFNLSRTSQTLVASARCIEGNLGNVRVTKTEIDDSELKIRTQLRSADALTNIGNHYKEFGLRKQADLKYQEALDTAEQVLTEARRLGGSVLENAYVQMWRTYFAMENYNLAVAMSQRLMREFPESAYVDEAMLQQGNAFRGRKDYSEAIRLYGSVLRLNESALKGEAQFGIAECYEAMAQAAPEQQAESLYERAFVEYQKIYEQFPESGRVGDAVAKMANFYYRKKDYARAVDVFENVLSNYPDANFLDVILFNYGRCLFRLERKPEARRLFDQLINEFPESTLAAESKKISDALVKAGF